MEIPLLQDIAVIFGLSVLVLLISHQIQLPTIVGFLLTGIFVGPHGLRRWAVSLRFGTSL